MLAEPGKKPRPILAVKSAVQYIDSGYLVFAREGTLVAQRFDPESGRVSGEPISIAEHVRYFLTTGFASFGASRTGTLAYQSQEDVSRLIWQLSIPSSDDICSNCARISSYRCFC